MILAHISSEKLSNFCANHFCNSAMSLNFSNDRGYYQVTMRRLYLIFIFLFMMGCESPDTPNVETSVGQVRPTIPPEWLTKPPTPQITPSVRSEIVAAVPNPENTPTLRSSAVDPEPSATSALTSTPFQTATPHSSPFDVVPTASLSQRLRISAGPEVPGNLQRAVRQLAEARPNDFEWVEISEETADIQLQQSDENPTTQWVYVVAAPFATIKDNVTLDEIRDLWTGDSDDEGQLIITGNTADVYAGQWGAPAVSVVQVNEEELVDRLWAERPSFTLLPFNQLTPRLKVMHLDGISPLTNTFSIDEYALSIPIDLNGDEGDINAFQTAWQMPATNRDPDKITRVAMTGVTALVRATATQMEIEGIETPAEDVGDVLRSADIAHISNEVAFAEDCPEPNPIGGTTFCSQDDYFALLEILEVDVIELTGNHINDWGPDAVHHTLDMYDAANMVYFGGGLNHEEAAKPALFEHNGNRIAFVGCNTFGPSYAWAGAASPGSRACGPEIFEQISELTAQGYAVIATQQYHEFYHYDPTTQQESDFKEFANAGAVAVSGSQGHHAQGFDFHNDAFIHYGLGNLFFDQMDMLGTRQSFVDTYTFYDGRLLNIELWTGLIEDFFKPRLMTAEEREDALQTLFQASGW